MRRIVTRALRAARSSSKPTRLYVLLGAGEVSLLAGVAVQFSLSWALIAGGAQAVTLALLTDDGTDGGDAE